jgi:hypothetical protein
VVVFGGPPCTKFCNAGSLFRPQREVLLTAKAELEAAEKRWKMLKVVGKSSTVASAEQRAEAESKVAEAQEIYRAAEAAVAQDDLGVREADGLVSRFLSLFQELQRKCQADGDVPCHLLMENPYSAEDRALWNR